MSHSEKRNTQPELSKILKHKNLKTVQLQQNVDTTVVTTPTPVSYSTAKKKQKKLVYSTESDLEESLGIMSIKSGDFDCFDPHENERRRALDCLERASIVSADLPSRLLRPSGKSSIGTNMFLGDESTISETDLLDSSPQHNSTARQSNVFSLPITCENLSKMSLAFKDTSKSIRDVLDESQRLSIASEMFDSKIAEKIDADRLAWKQQYAAIPVDQMDLSDVSCRQTSMGDFFAKRSDDLSQVLGLKTPEKKQRSPQALVDISDYSNMTSEKEQRSAKALVDISDYNNYSTRTNRDVGLSLIQKILEDNNKTPGKALDCLLGKESYLNNKENIRTSLSPEHNNKSVASSRSSSSLSTLPNGRLPLEATKTELVWGNVKLGKNEIREFTIRNKSSCRLKLQCKVLKPSFKLLKERPGSDSVEQLKKFVLRPFETRTIYVIFAPVAKGAAYDEVVFAPVEPHLEMAKKQSIKLYGYGGHGVVSIDKVSRNPYGRCWLAMGTLSKPKECTISLKNTGILPSFAYIHFESKELYKFKNISIIPNSIVLQPTEEKEVVLKFNPSREDLNFMRTTPTPVTELGTLKVVSGTEALRGRIWKLHRTVHNSKHALHNIAEQLSTAFPGQCIPKDLCFINEPVTYMQDLVSMLTNHEIGLIVDEDPDETLTSGVIEDTTTFHTLCHETTPYVDVDHCNVEPNMLILTPPKKSEDVIFLESDTDKNFEIICCPARGLNVEPRRGLIRKGLPTLVRVSCDINSYSSYKVMVNIETESFQVDVKIVPV